MTEKSDKLDNLFNSIEEVRKNSLELICDYLPKDVARHLRSAHKEQLLAMRAMIDATIEKIEKREKEETVVSEKVEVE